jgi:hypothetical protein
LYSQIYNRLRIGPIPNPWILPNVRVHKEYKAIRNLQGDFDIPTNEAPTIAGYLAGLGVLWDFQTGRVVIQQSNSMVIRIDPLGEPFYLWHETPTRRIKFGEVHLYMSQGFQMLYVDLDALTQIFGQVG